MFFEIIIKGNGEKWDCFFFMLNKISFQNFQLRIYGEKRCKKKLRRRFLKASM
ncbi:hypothetical protein PGB90_005594 [Kerria lacca]